MSKVLVDELYPLVEKAMSKTDNQLKLKRVIEKFIDKNGEALGSAGPTRLILFTELDKKPVYEICDTTEEFVKSLRLKSKDIKADGYTMAYPLNSILPMIVRYFTIKNNQSMVSLCMCYLTLSMYPMLYKKYFKFDPNENIMNYTIEHLSGRYKIRQTGSLFTALQETGYGGYELHKKVIIRGEDKDIVDFVLSVRTRLNMFIRKISQAFYENEKSGNYLNLEFESNDDENFREADSSIQGVARVVDKVVMKLIIHGPPMNLITLAAKMNKASLSELRNYLTRLITSDKKDDISKVVESILFIYIIDGGNRIDEINSNQFIIECLEMYSKSHTNDKNVIRVKGVLDKWLDELGQYKKTQNLGTINNFRRALYTFFVFAIQKNNLG